MEFFSKIYAQHTDRVLQNMSLASGGDLSEFAISSVYGDLMAEESRLDAKETGLLEFLACYAVGYVPDPPLYPGIVLIRHPAARHVLKPKATCMAAIIWATGKQRSKLRLISAMTSNSSFASRRIESLPKIGHGSQRRRSGDGDAALLFVI